jgi:asparagine synthase (glutamine-hydrolysing)
LCRIAGIIDKTSQQASLDVVAMRDAMKRGGPDNAGLYHDGEVKLALGHRRLSIIDLSDAGNQPMTDENQNIILVFNGEIYNYPALKQELITAGARFNTHTDTEVIIKAYQHWGNACFARFRGMFAIALYDKIKGELILARDHAGIKPLYYYHNNTSLYFASEIRAFESLKSKWQERTDWKVFLLTYGYLPEPVTTLKDVHPLEKGSYKIFNVHTLAARQEYFYQDTYSEDIQDLDVAKELIKNSLEQAVERHLIADAPIGLFLSGGIDSSLLTLLAQPHKKDNLHTLSIIFDDKHFSEQHYQDIVVRKAQSQHRSFLLSRELFDEALPDILMAMDQPSTDGINSYFICKFAKEAGLKAVLSGLGADELLGGYSSFKMAGLLNRVKYVPGFFFGMADVLPKDKYKKLGFLERKDGIGEYLISRGYFNPRETARLLDMNLGEVNTSLQAISIPQKNAALSNGNRTAYLESNLYMQGQLLKDTDAMSMWHSIEVRVPFLDLDFINAVNSISSNLKFGDKQAKYLLIESFKDILPREIWDRKKQGFVFPFQSWMKNNLGQFMPAQQDKRLTARFENGKLSWSRYWAYLVTKIFAATSHI